MNVLSSIFEKINYTIDDDVKGLLRSKKAKKEMLKKYGETAFLDSKNLKFPVINPKTGNYDCRLIYACILRSAANGAKIAHSKDVRSYYYDIKLKAAALYRTQKCSEKIKAKLLTDSNEEVDLLVMNSIFDITEQEIDIILNDTNYID